MKSNASFCVNMCHPCKTELRSNSTSIHTADGSHWDGYQPIPTGIHRPAKPNFLLTSSKLLGENDSASFPSLENTSNRGFTSLLLNPSISMCACPDPRFCTPPGIFLVYFVLNQRDCMNFPTHPWQMDARKKNVEENSILTQPFHLCLILFFCSCSFFPRRHLCTTVRRTLKNGLSEEEKQHVASLIKGY